jgi:hypothetical protein
MDQRITTASVLIVDDDIKIHIDDIEVLHEVWLKYPKYIIGTFPRWFGVSASNKLFYTQFEYNPKLATGVEYGLMLTKVMLIQTTYLFEYTCGNEDSTILHPTTYDCCESCYVRYAVEGREAADDEVTLEVREADGSGEPMALMVPRDLDRHAAVADDTGLTANRALAAVYHGRCMWL